ncbi:general substrate transporter [Pisolithus orientalis]|uniref:general substrate transporter n=1 Tax=Pisolithus orientalis TaxID=936130 RepID=UPI0022254A78|nr:general substrate transporter [Pisolithus orientalis]KAI6019993.1 general substrate transporter [Pisolithus orientalis]
MGVGPAAVAGAVQDTSFAHLLNPNRKWYNNKRIIILNAWIVLLLITSSTNGYDGSMMNGLQSLQQWQDDFNHPSKGRLGLLNAIQNVGALAGYPFAPYLSDGIGRRKTVFLGATIMLVATALQTASQSVGMFIGARFLIGFGLTFAANAAPMLVTELAYPEYRAPLTSLYNSLWYSGSIVAAWATYGTFRINNTWAWRLPSLLQGIPAALQFSLVLFCPESPRWLVSRGRDAEALRALAYYHADGDEQDPLIQYEFREIKTAIEFDRNVAANVGWKSLIATRGNLKRMRIIVALAFFSQWSGNGLISYYLNEVFTQIGIADSGTQLLINGVLQVWNLFWAVLAAFMVDRLGRRFLFLSSAALMTLFYTAQAVCFAEYSKHGVAAAGHAVVGFVFLFFAAYDIAFTPLIVSYTVEILPFSLRAKGFNVFSFVISVALIFNQYVNPIALDALGWKYYLVYVCWLAVEFVFLWFFLVETKNRTLEETAAIFDGEDALRKIAHGGTVQETPDIYEKADGKA